MPETFLIAKINGAGRCGDLYVYGTTGDLAVDEAVCFAAASGLVEFLPARYDSFGDAMEAAKRLAGIDDEDPESRYNTPHGFRPTFVPMSA